MKKNIFWMAPALALAACAPVQQTGMTAGGSTAAARTPAPAPASTQPVNTAAPAKPAPVPAAPTATEAPTTPPATPQPAHRDDWTPVPTLSAAPVRQFTKAEQVTDPSKVYRAVLETTKGPITLELYPAKAPNAVNNFVFLALNGFYDGTRFHRVIDGFMAQGGDPKSLDLSKRSEWGTGGPGYQFPYEVNNGLDFNSAGVLGMARSASPSSQGSQFFITLAPAPFLNNQYTAFGRVIDGMNALNALTKTATGGDQPIAGAEPDTLKSVTILAR